MAKIVNVRCEFLNNPIGIETKNPTITWCFENGEGEKFRQKSFKILFGKDKDNLIKESGVINSQSMKYTFKETFKSREKIYYQVISYTDKNKEIKSEINCFEIGLLEKREFKAKWIRANINKNIFKKCRLSADYFLKIFNISQEKYNEIKSARAYISALGLYEVKINGVRVGDFVLAPGSTDYNKRIQYQTYDVTDLIRVGENKIEVVLGDGWFRGANGGSGKPNTFGRLTRFYFQLEVKNQNDEITYKVLSDKTWKWSNDGPIRFNDIKDGEIVDATLTPTYSFNAKESSFSKNKKLIAKLHSSNNFYVKEMEFHKPIKEIITPSKKHILVFENNLAGYIHFRVNAKRGNKIHLVMGEWLDEKGELSLLNIQDHTKYGDTPLQEITYVCHEGINDYRPKFYFGGFRYCLIETDIENYSLKDFEQVAVYSAFEKTADFECSNELINVFYKNTLNSFKANSVDVPTDCPTRERAGWTGDSQLFFNTASYLVNFAPFAKKHIRDVIDRQKRNGAYPCIAPNANDPLFLIPMTGSSGWADVGILIPYYLYKKYGDVEFLKEIYPSMLKYVKFLIKRIGKINIPFNKKVNLSRKDKKFLVRKGQSFGEWLEPDDIAPFDWKDIAFPHPEVSTAYTYLVLNYFKEINEALGYSNKNLKLDLLIKGLKSSYEALVNTKEFSLDTNRQANLVRPLFFNLLNEEQKEFAQKRLIKALDEYDWRIGTGFLSTPFILYVLLDIDSKYAFKLLENEKMPGWLYIAKNSTGSVWESWEGVKKGFGLSSLNHYSKGAVVEFFFAKILGINVVNENRYKITPNIGGNLTYARGFYDSIYGKVSVYITKDNNKTKIDISIPPNTEAEFVYKNMQKNLESGSYNFIFED